MPLRGGDKKGELAMRKKTKKVFIPSGLDAAFDRILHRRAEAIAKGWIVAIADEPAQEYVDQLRAVEPDEPEKKREKELNHETK